MTGVKKLTGASGAARLLHVPAGSRRAPGPCYLPITLPHAQLIRNFSAFQRQNGRKTHAREVRGAETSRQFTGKPEGGWRPRCTRAAETYPRLPFCIKDPFLLCRRGIRSLYNEKGPKVFTTWGLICIVRASNIANIGLFNYVPLGIL